jgi:D-serine deaminase-like pyridoxal phosphate-dependent protein
MDVATISALAAAAAAIGAFSVAGVQLYVGHRQSEAALKAADAALMNAQSAWGSLNNTIRHAGTTQSRGIRTAVVALAA